MRTDSRSSLSYADCPQPAMVNEPIQEKETINDQVDSLAQGMLELNAILGSVSGFIASYPCPDGCDKMGSGGDLQGKLAFLQTQLREAVREANTIHRNLGCGRDGMDKVR